MSGFCRVTLLGRLTRDPELKYLENGKGLAKFGLAVNRGKDDVTFFDCVAWEKTAEVVAQYAAKGRELLVDGRISVREWKTDAGEKRKAWEIVAERVALVGSKGEATEKAPDPATPEKPEDEVPF